MVDSPQPANLSYLWNFGSLLGTCLILQILTGIFLAMHYIPNVDLAFTSVEHIMRDVNNGWAVRYTHANVASFFFIFVYAHIARGLYYGSYKSPRVLVWAIGVIILVVMMATAFLGYVLPYGQMSLWGLPKLALNAFLIIDIILFSIEGCLDNLFCTSVSSPLDTYYCNSILPTTHSLFLIPLLHPWSSSSSSSFSPFSTLHPPSSPFPHWDGGQGGTPTSESRVPAGLGSSTGTRDYPSLRARSFPNGLGEGQPDDKGTRELMNSVSGYSESGNLRQVKGGTEAGTNESGKGCGAVIKRDLVKYDSNSKIVKLKAKERIGPHNLDILSLIFGSLLGGAQVEYRVKGTRISFYQESKHSAYLMWLHNIVSNLGYCNPIEPKIQKRLGQKGVVRNVVRFNTWTYSSFNWIHELWYQDKIKVVPYNIGDYFTPIALAFWLMEGGFKSGSSLTLATNSFTFSECLQLVKVLYDKYNIKANVQSAHGPTLHTQGSLLYSHHTHTLPPSSSIPFNIPHPFHQFTLGLPFPQSTVLGQVGEGSGPQGRMQTGSVGVPDSLEKGVEGGLGARGEVVEVENQYVIYIFKESMPMFRDLVLPYVHPSMKYKINY